MASSQWLWILVPSIVLGGLLMFVGIWCGVCMLLASIGGYRSLSKFRCADASTGTPIAPAWVVYFGPVSYKSHIVQMTSSPEGLGLRVMRLFVGHPDLRIPWDRVELGGEGMRGTTVVLDGRVHMHVPRELAEAITRARPR